MFSKAVLIVTPLREKQEKKITNFTAHLAAKNDEEKLNK